MSFTTGIGTGTGKVTSILDQILIAQILIIIKKAGANLTDTALKRPARLEELLAAVDATQNTPGFD